MRLQQLEAWTLSAVERAVAGYKVEDDRVELKSEWPDPGHRTARRIAAHANSANSDDILWVIGIDEKAREVVPISHLELANWWPRVQRWFDGPVPALRSLSITTDGGQVEALHFTTNQAPYVVNTEGGGQVEREIPWREGNATRTARRHEILRSLVAEATAPDLELITASAALFVDERERQPQTWEIQGHKVEFSAELYISGPDPVTFPAHKQNWRLESSAGEGVELTPVEVRGTYRFNGYSQSGVRKREYMGPVEIFANNELLFHGSGPVSVTVTLQIDSALAKGIQNWAAANLAIDLPVALTNRTSTLRAGLLHVVGSLHETPADPEFNHWRQLARFEFDPEQPEPLR